MSVERDLAHIRERLGEYYSPTEVEAFLHAPQILLDGALPIRLIEAGEVGRVNRLIEALDLSIYL